MTIRHLKIFVIVYQNMSVTKAAKLLHIAQPAVTRSIQELENDYGVCLFDRLNHRLYRTPLADELYTRACHILESLDELDSTLRHNGGSKILNIGSTMTIGNFMLPDVVSQFSRICPSVQVKVIVSKSFDIQQRILDNRLDFALVEENVSAEYLEKEYLAADCMRLILPKNHYLAGKKRIYMKDISQFPLLLREKGSATRTFLDHIFAIHEMEVNPIWESASPQALINAVANGIGISILPEKLVQQDVEAGRIESKKLQDEELKRKSYIIWHRQKIMSDELKQLKDLCKKTASGGE